MLQFMHFTTQIYRLPLSDPSANPAKLSRISHVASHYHVVRLGEIIRALGLCHLISLSLPPRRKLIDMGT
jgi:hypothetical protein